MFWSFIPLVCPFEVDVALCAIIQFIMKNSLFQFILFFILLGVVLLPGFFVKWPLFMIFFFYRSKKWSLNWLVESAKRRITEYWDHAKPSSVQPLLKHLWKQHRTVMCRLICSQFIFDWIHVCMFKVWFRPVICNANLHMICQCYIVGGITICRHAVFLYTGIFIHKAHISA